MTSERPQPFLGRVAERISAPGRSVLVASTVLFVLGVVSVVFSKGTTVHVTTNAPNARVEIDGRRGSRSDPNTWRFEGIPWGTREALVAHRDYISKTTALDVGAFGDGRFQIDIERRTVRLTVQTTPGAEVFLDGQTFGKANDAGVFFSDKIFAGAYAVSIQRAGYEQSNFRSELHDDNNSLLVHLQMTQARRQEIGRQRDRAFELMQEANSLFGRRNYQAALAAINESIRLYPEDDRAGQLRDRIVETINILK